jgi:hypothetical protein
MNPKGPLHIALDYDGTYTRDPQLWDWFITQAQLRGHVVTVVTMRHATEVIPLQPPCEVIYTGRKAKQSFYLADIWIDDQPLLISNDHWSIA